MRVRGGSEGGSMKYDSERREGGTKEGNKRRESGESERKEEGN